VANRRTHPPNYRAAQLAARQREGALQADAAERIVKSIRQYADQLARLVRNLPAGERGARESVVVLRNVARTLERQLQQAIAEGRDLTFQEVQNIWQQASLQIAAQRDVPSAFLGGITNPPLSLLGAYENVNGAANWKTLTSRYVARAAEEASQIIRHALLSDMSPDELARRLRPYVQGSERFVDAFRGSGLDMRSLRSPDVADAAAQMQYNAYRIAVSETHNARSEAEVQNFIADPYVKAVGWRLSPDRGTLKGPDECDVLAGNNFYGLGVGNYPVDAVPLTPHPFDRCERVPITQDQPNPKQTNVGQTLDTADATIPRSGKMSDAMRDRVLSRTDAVLTMSAEDPQMQAAVSALTSGSKVRV
jgi:hypothetical protein